MEVPEVVTLRLPLYVRALRRLENEGNEIVSSQQLGRLLQMTPAQIRKDLSYFGRFGKQGQGYNIEYLLRELRQILGLDREWRACVVGVGRLGGAIISYPGLSPEGFKLVAAFDANPSLVSEVFDDIKVQPMSDLAKTITRLQITIGIVAVPSSHAQEVIDELVECGIKAILSYAPLSPQVPSDVKVRTIDPVLSLQSMTYYLRLLEDAPLAENSAS